MITTDYGGDIVRRIISFVICFALIVLPMSVIAHAEDEMSETVFSLNIIKETDDYVTVSVRLESGSFNSVDLRFVATSENIEDCVYIDESDEFYLFLLNAKRAGGAVMSLPYSEPGKYGFATTIAYDITNEDIIICKFLKAVPDSITTNDISLEIISCTDLDENLETEVISKLPIFDESHLHDYVMLVETVPETCCSNGYVLYKCSCGASFPFVIPPHAHTLLHMTSDASCSHSGMEFDFCRECNGIFNQKSIEPAEHDWDDWELKAFPTENELGFAERKCSNCDTVENMELDFVFGKCLVDGTTVSGIKAGLTAESFKEHYIKDSSPDIIISPFMGNKIGTGSEITVIYNDDIVVTYTVLLYGDISGDGLYDGQDSLLASFIVNGMLTEDSIGTVAYRASDCNHDGITDETDVSILSDAGLLLSEIAQTSSLEELEASSVYSDYVQLIDQNPSADETITEKSLIELFIERIMQLIKQCLFG